MGLTLITLLTFVEFLQQVLVSKTLESVYNGPKLNTTLSQRRSDLFGNKCQKILLKDTFISLFSQPTLKHSSIEDLTKVLPIGWMKEQNSEKSSVMVSKLQLDLNKASKII